LPRDVYFHLDIECEGGPRDAINLDDFNDVRAISQLLVYSGLPFILKIPD